MKALLISGSNRKEGTNLQLLNFISGLMPTDKVSTFDISILPMFLDQPDPPINDHVAKWKKALAETEVVIITTPEYLHNIPAALKSALEWTTSSGDFLGKRVLAITYTPHPPRGEKAMQSLIWSLQALDALVVAQLSLYRSDVTFNKGMVDDQGGVEMLKEALQLLKQ